MSEPCDGCHADATHFLCDECLGEDEQDKLRAEVERLREALEAAVDTCRLDCTHDSYCGRCKPMLAALAGSPVETRREKAKP